MLEPEPLPSEDIGWDELPQVQVPVQEGPIQADAEAVEDPAGGTQLGQQFHSVSHSGGWHDGVRDLVLPHQVDIPIRWEVHLVGVGATSVGTRVPNPMLLVRYHCGGRPTEVNACILITHMVYL